MSREWQEIKLAPVGEIIETKIDDQHGDRNHALLKRDGHLWFVPDGSMYVYYAPTHFRAPTAEQMEDLARSAENEAQELLRRAANYRGDKP